MSAISAEPIAVIAPDLEVRPSLRVPLREPLPRPIEQPRPRVAPRTAPKVRTRPNTRTAAGRKTRTLSTAGIVVMKMALFGSVALPTWVVSNLAGHVMTASAHKDWKQAYERANSAVKATTALRSQVIAMTSDQTAEAWAVSHQMVAAEDAKPVRREQAQLVALNP